MSAIALAVASSSSSPLAAAASSFLMLALETSGLPLLLRGTSVTFGRFAGGHRRRVLRRLCRLVRRYRLWHFLNGLWRCLNLRLQVRDGVQDRGLLVGSLQLVGHRIARRLEFLDTQQRRIFKLLDLRLGDVGLALVVCREILELWLELVFQVVSDDVDTQVFGRRFRFGVESLGRGFQFTGTLCRCLLQLLHDILGYELLCLLSSRGHYRPLVQVQRPPIYAVATAARRPSDSSSP